MHKDATSEITYLADLIDTHGTFCIHKDSRLSKKKKEKTAYLTYSASFVIALKEKDTIERFKEFFGVGSAKCIGTRYSTKGWHVYKIRSKNELISFIRIISPYIKYKSDQIRTILTLYDDPVQLDIDKLMALRRNLREYCYLKMRQLNKRKPAATKLSRLSRRAHTPL